MKKWFMNQKTNENSQKRLTRKERYLEKYMDSYKCLTMFETLIQRPKSQINTFLQQVRMIYPIAETALEQDRFQQFTKLYEPSQGSLIAIFVVGFHHKRGSEIEYQYPTIDSDQLELIHNKVAVYALPDAVHNSQEDFLYFNFPANIDKTQTMLFGITYFKQIKVTEQMRLEDPALTRNHIQKAICLLATVPLFGYLKERIEPTINAYFQLQNFKDTSLIQFAFENIQQKLDYSRITIAEIQTDTNLQALFFIFKDKTIKIIKAMLLELKYSFYSIRIVIFSLSSSICSKAIISLLSALPGLLNFGMNTNETLICQNYTAYGLPLQLFGDRYKLFMHFSVNDLAEINDNDKYIIGTTNKFIKTTPKLNPDIIIDIDAESIWIKEEHKKLLNTKFYDKLLFNNIHNIAIKNLESNQEKELLKKFATKNNAINDEVRNLVNSYLFKMFETIGYMDYNCTLFEGSITRLTTIRTRRSILEKTQDSNSSEEEEGASKQYQTLNTEITEDPDVRKSRRQIVKELQIKEFQAKIHCLYKYISKINKKFVQKWIKDTRNSQIWFASHDFSIYSQTECYDSGLPHHSILPNGNILIHDTQSALIEVQSKCAYIGEVVDGQKEGFGRYNSMEDKFTFRGHFHKNKKQGKGKLTCQQGKYQYDGNFENDQFHGIGNLLFGDSVYEGQFDQGVYFGTGKLIMPNRDVYVGSFIDGKFNGDGQYVWANGDIYKGQFKQNMKHGIGYFQKNGNEEQQSEQEWLNDCQVGVAKE